MNEVLQWIVDATPAATPRGPWRFLTRSPNVRAGTKNPRELARELERKFGAPRLEELGVYRRIGSTMTLAGVLARPNQPFVVLRDKRRAVCDLVNQAGGITSRVPLLSCFNDMRTAERARQYQAIFAPISNKDLVLARLLKLPCTPAGPLAELSGDEARRLYARVRRGKSDQSLEQAEIVTSGVTVYVAAFDLRKLSTQCPTGLNAIVSHLAAAESMLQVDHDTNVVRVWLPTPADIDRMRDALILRDEKLLRDEVLASLVKSSTSVYEFRQSLRRQQSTYVAAFAKFSEACDRTQTFPHQRHEAHEAFSNLQRVFDGEFLDRNVAKAVAEADPLRAALRLAANGFLTGIFRSTANSRLSSADGRCEADHDEIDSLTQLRQATESLMKIVRTLAQP